MQKIPSLRALGLCSVHSLQWCQFSPWTGDGKNLSNLVQVPELKWWIWTSNFYLLISKKCSLKQSPFWTLLSKLQLTVLHNLLFVQWYAYLFWGLCFKADFQLSLLTDHIHVMYIFPFGNNFIEVFPQWIIYLTFVFFITRTSHFFDSEIHINIIR